MESHRLLYVDDEAAGRDANSEYLRKHGFVVETAATSATALAKVAESAEPFATIIVDYNLVGDAMTGAELTRAILEKDPEAYIIVYSSDPSQVAATKSWSAGAVFFVNKEKGDDLLVKVREQCARYDEFRAALSVKKLTSMNSPVIAQANLVGRSTDLADSVRQILRYRKNREVVLIMGESGAGKEGLAQALREPNKEFIAINCAEFKNEDMLESELFGHEKGAYTGADKQKKGFFETVGDGVLFLDEIHEMSLGSQAKLLRALQEKVFRRLHGAVEIPFRGRLVVASKATLPQFVKDGTFKEDLYYRINTLPVTIAPLRDRRDDIAPLIQHFCDKYKKDYGHAATFRKRAVRLMEQYDWPGNVRELSNVVVYLLTNCTGKYVESAQLPDYITAKTASLEMTWDQFQKKQFADRRDFLAKVCESSPRKADASRRLGIQANAIHALLKTYKLEWTENKMESAAETVVLE